MKRKQRFWVTAFLLPAVIIFLVYFLFPVGFLVYTSFMSWDGIGEMSFIGLENYKRLIEDEVFHESLINTLLWGAAATFIQIPMALLLAMILSKKVKGYKFFRTVFLFPNFISIIALALIWVFIYNSQYGLLNWLLETIGLSEWQHNWLGEISTALPAVIGSWIFYVGIFMLIFMAYIATIDKSLYEAAKIDGANIFQMEWHITLPLLKPSILAGVLLAITFTLKNFETTFAMTNGGPIHETMVLSLYIYKNMHAFNYGYADTLSVMLILVGAFMILFAQLLFREKNS